MCVYSYSNVRKDNFADYDMVVHTMIPIIHSVATKLINYLQIYEIDSGGIETHAFEKTGA